MGSNPSASLLTFAWPLFVFLATLFTVRIGQKEGGLSDFEDDFLDEGGEF